MTKVEFLRQLEERIAGLPREDIERSLEYYSEIIDDRIEDGCGEEEAVASLGSVDKVASEILADMPLAKIVKERVRPKRILRTWEIFLIVLGSPVWVPLLIAAISVVFAIYIVLWSLVVSVAAVVISLGAAAVACVFGGTVIAIFSKTAMGIVCVGAGLLLAGLTMFAYFGCVYTVKGIVFVSKKIWLGIKYCFIGKESSK